jgi:hypothetical protein
MAIPCTVIVREALPEREVVSLPVIPPPPTLVLRTVPQDSSTKQLIRTAGDTSTESFIVFDNSTGHVADITRCKFVFTLYSTKPTNEEANILYKLIGVVSNPLTGIVSFTPSEENMSRTGFFYYDVQMLDAKGVAQTLISNSYVFKKAS